jgi:hypothetical protein
MRPTGMLWSAASLSLAGQLRTLSVSASASAVSASDVSAATALRNADRSASPADLAASMRSLALQNTMAPEGSGARGHGGSAFALRP